MGHADKSTYYRIQGLTCTSCAAKFEKSVKELPGVKEARVNFGASKLAIIGDPELYQLHKAGANNGLKLFPENEHPSYSRLPFWKNKNIQRVIISALLLLIAWISQFIFPESSTLITSLYISSILVGGTTLFSRGFRNLLRLQFDMNALMTIAIIGAAAIGEWKEGATVVILFAISEALETYSMDKARKSIQSLVTLAPKQALVLKDGKEVYTPVDKIHVGDTIMVKPGEKLAMDGIILRGTSHINEASITGESMPMSKKTGDEVFAGTLNTEGTLEIKVTKRVEDTTLAKIIHLVEEAQGERAPSQAFIDRFAQVYTPIILIVATLVTLIPPLLFNGDWGDWLYRGLALLVVGCPCALVISTPIAIVTAIGNAARNGVLIKGGIHIEEVAKLSTIAFDKTGTLTKGAPTVTDILPLNGTQEETFLAIAAAIEKNSQHPVASAIIQKGNEKNLSYDHIEVHDFTSITGMGVKAVVNEELYYIGNHTLFEKIFPSGIPQNTLTKMQQLQNQGKTAMFFGTDKRMIALIAVADELRDSSYKAIKDLHLLGISKTMLLTGDNYATAKTIQNKVGIHDVHANLLPQEKLDHINTLKQSGAKVAMVGDGVNDAPALAAASVGIAMGGAGTDTALETADIVLMGDDLKKIPFIIQLSRQTLAIIKQNISLSLLLKGTALLLILPGWLTLWMAVLSDMGATVLVTLNSLRMAKKG